MRKLATVRTINEINPIDGADAIETAVVDGWKVVTKKGEFAPGDKCVYIEVDSFLPEGNPDWQFLIDKKPKSFNNKNGHVLKTIKLRGQISQGLLIRALPGMEGDVSDLLGIEKYEKPVPASLRGLAAGNFPSFIRKTDQERCQNLKNEILSQLHEKFEVSVKLDGSSITIYHKDGHVGICSRNLELKNDESNKDNTFILAARELGVTDCLKDLGNFAIQGELMGPGIQGNKENLTKPHVFIFDIFDIDNQKYLTPQQRRDMIFEMGIMANASFAHVPVLHESISLHNLGVASIDNLLRIAEGESLFAKEREGLVFKRIDGEFSFKAISNRFLLKESE